MYPKNKNPKRLLPRATASSNLNKALVFFLTAGSCCTVAVAVEEDMLTPYVNYSINYDDNIFRLHDSAAAMATLGTEKMSDTTQIATGGLRFDKKFSQQHLKADFNLSRQKYNSFSQFDHDSRAYQANWNWHAGTHLDGNLGGNYSKTLAPFTEYLSLTPNVTAQQNNMRSHQRAFADAGWLLHPSWRVRGGYSRYEQDYELDTQRANDGTLDTGELGLDYLVQNNSSVGLLVRKLRGRYFNEQSFGLSSVNNSYEQNEFKGKIVWQFSEKTQMQFIGGWANRKYDNFSERDSSGINTRFVGNWKATSKLVFSMGAWREIGELNYLSANFGMTRGINVGALWKITDILKLNGVLLRETRDYNGVTPLAGTATASHNDRYYNAMLKLTYLPTRHLTIDTSVYHYVLGSSLPQLGYRGSGALLNTRYEF